MFPSHDLEVNKNNHNIKGIELNEKINNRCATPVGKVRAQQLAQGKPISEETIKRMYSYLSRAEKTYREVQNDSTACGNISYLLWGGLAGLGWSRNKLRELGLLEESEVQPSINSTYPGEAGIPVSGSDESTGVLDEAIAQVEEAIGMRQDNIYMDDIRWTLFPSKELAEKVAIMIGCSGSHPHTLENGKTYWMPCETHPEGEPSSQSE